MGDHRHATTRGARLLAGLLAATIAGATVAATADGGGASVTAKPKRGGSVSFGLEAETTGGFCIPTSQLAISGIQVAAAIYDTLVVPGPDGKMQPYLAKSLTPNADATEWTITLRDGVKFHDGTPLDANVVKQNIDAWKQGRLFSFVFKDVAGVTVVDPLTLKVATTRPWSNFDAFLFLVGRAGILAPAQLADPDSCARNLIGTGPFKLQEWKPNDKLVVVRNPDYWQKGLPYLDKITFRPVVEAQARVAQLEGGQLDLMHTSSAAQIDALRSGSGEQVYAEKPGRRELRYYLLNDGKAPFDDIRARQAVAYALDRKQLNNILNRGIPEVTDQFFDSKVLGHLKNPGFPKYDPAKARKLVQEVKRDTGSFDITVSTITDPENQKEAQLIAEQFKKVGIGVDTRFRDQSTQINEVLQGSYTFEIWRNHPGEDPDTQYVWWSTGSPVNFGRFADPTIQEALDTGRTSNDPTVREKAYETVARQRAKMVYEVPGWWIPWVIAHDEKVQGLEGPRIPGSKDKQLFIYGRIPVHGLYLQ